jgi:tetratricopeptide (TPR) repeat protein
VGHAVDTWSRVERVLDSYAAGWKTSSEQACAATRVRGEQSEAALELRQACLEERLDGLRALTDVLSSADAKVVENAAIAAHDLAPIEPCSELDRLSAGARLPPDPRLRGEIRDLQGELAAAKALNDAGKDRLCLDRLDAVRARVESASYGPLRVSWTMLGAQARSSSDPKAAAAAYEEAFALADSFRLDEPKVKSALYRAELEDEWLENHDAARLWRRLAGSALERMGGDVRLQVALDIEEGWVAARTSRSTDVFERALERMRAARIDDPILIGQAYGGIAETFSNRGHPELGIEPERLALAQYEKTYGPESVKVATTHANLASIETMAGKLDDAVASASRAVATLDEIVRRGDVGEVSDYLAWAEDQLGYALVRLGRAGEGVELLARARELLAKTVGVDSGYRLKVGVELAEANRMVGNEAEAVRLLDEAEARAPKIDDTYCVLGSALLERAKLEMMRGNGQRALPAAQRALVLLQQALVTDVYRIADASLVLARALKATRGDGTLAQKLARQARDGFSQLDDRPGVEAATSLLATPP